MDPAIMGAIVIACCFAAGVFSGRDHGGEKGNQDKTTPGEKGGRR